MLLNIDKVLQLLCEGKDVKKISEMGGMDVSEVVKMIDEARVLLNKHESGKVRKKVLIRKKASSDANRDEMMHESIFEGAEFAAVPVDDTLVMYVAVHQESHNATVAILINDAYERQVGKVIYKVSEKVERSSLIKAIARAFEIASYFNAKTLKVRFDDEYLFKQFEGIIPPPEGKISAIYNEIDSLSKKLKSYKLEYISKAQNDKANHFAMTDLKAIMPPQV